MLIFAIIAMAAASLLVAAVAVLALLALVNVVIGSREAGRHRARRAEDLVDDAYRDARRAMNEAAKQSWRNLVD